MARKKSASKAKPARQNPTEVVEEQVEEVVKTKKEKKEATKKVIITVFSIIIAISMMLPMVGTIVQSKRQERMKDPSKVTMTDIDGEFTGRITQLESEAKKTPDDAFLQVQIGQTYTQWAQSVVWFSKGEDISKHTDDLYTKATDAYNKALEIDGSNQAAAQGIVGCYAAWGQSKAGVSLDEAGKLYQKAIDICDKRAKADATGRYDLSAGQIYSQWAISCNLNKAEDKAKELNESAMKCFDKAIAADENNVDAYIAKCNLISDTDSVDAAIEEFKPVVEKHADNTNALIYMGGLYQRAENSEKALEYFEKVEKADPDNLQGNNSMAKNYIDAIKNPVKAESKDSE